MTFTIQSIRLDGSDIVASIVVGEYDVDLRLDVNEFVVWAEKEQYDEIDWGLYWRYALQLNGKGAYVDLTDYISQSPYLLSTLADAVKLKEIEGVLYDEDKLRRWGGYGVCKIAQSDCDHLHALITQYADMRVETEKLKTKIV
jgi:hypothetical protein